MSSLYPDIDSAIAFLRTKGAAWDKQHRDLIIRGPLSLRMLAALDYIQKQRVVYYTKNDQGVRGAVVSRASFSQAQKEAA